MANEFEMIFKAKAVLGQAQKEISGFLGKIEKEAENVNNQFATGFPKTAAFAAGVRGALVGVAAAGTAFVGVVTAMSAAIVQLGQRGSEVADVKDSFADLTRNIAPAPAILNALRSATDGVISDFALMKATNKALSLGLTGTVEQFALLGEGARLMANRMGIDAVDAYSTLTKAAATGNAKLLMSAGIMIDAKKASEEYAKQIGKEASELSKSEKAIALRTEMFKQLRAEVERTGGVEASFADRIEQVKVAFTNFNDQLSLAVATSPVLNEALGFIAESIQNAFGANQEETIRTLVSWINKFAIFVVDAATAVTQFASIAGQAFYGVRQVLFTVLAAIGDFGLKVGDMMIKLVDMASGIPKIGHQFKAFGDQLRSERATLDGFTQSFHETANQAAKDGQNWANGANAIMGKLGTLRVKMEELDKQGVSSAQIQKAMQQQHQKTGEAAGKQSKEVEKVTKAIREMDASMKLAASNGALDLWISENHDKLMKLAIQSKLTGATISKELGDALLKGAVENANIDAAKRQKEIMAQIAKDAEEAQERSNKNFIAQKEREIDALQEAQKKAKELQEKHDKEALARAEAHARSWTGIAERWAKGIPDMLVKSFQGGGGFGGALKGMLSQGIGDIGTKIFQGEGFLNKLTGGIQKSGIGASLAGTIAGVAGGFLTGGLSLLAPVAIKGVTALFGKVFGSADKKATKELQGISAELKNVFGGMENIRALSKATGIDMEAAFNGKGKKGLENLKAVTEQFKAKVAELQTQFKGWTDEALKAGVKLPETYKPYLDQLVQMGLITKENAAALSGFGENGKADFDAMKAAADRLGVSIEALGPAFQQAAADKSAQQIFDDIMLLVKGGADLGGVLHGAADELSKLAQDSMKFGTTVPENFRPWMEQLIASGELLDENGEKITDINKINFGDTIISSLDKIIDRFDLLLQGLGLIPKAIDAIPKNVDVNVNLNERVNRSQDGGGGDPSQPEVEVPGAAAGGLFSSPTFRVVGEREPEVVGSPNVIVSALAEAMKQTGLGGGGNGAPTAVNFNVHTPIATVDTIRQLWYNELGPIMLQWIEDNRNGARTSMQEKLGVTTE